MKRILLTPLILLLSLTLSAQLAEGYYRIQNKVTSRYISVSDNSFTINMGATDADLSALTTIRDYNRIICDPGSIIHIKGTGSGYIFKAQGTDTHSSSGGRYLQLRAQGDAYRAFVKEGGVMKYLCDEYDPDNEYDESFVFTSDSRTRDWYIKPINSTDNYLGLTPTITDGTHYYQTLYASFPFSFTSEAIKAYRISKVDQGMAVMEEIEGEIPAATPVLIKTSSNEAATNKLNILLKSGATQAKNVLKGNYFDNDWRNSHTPYVASTMRILGTLANGKIGFVKDKKLKNLPANKAYLPVPADCADEVRLVTKEEYELTNSIESVENTTDVKVKAIYTLNGQQVTTPRPNHVYIIVYSNGTREKRIF